MLAVIGRLLVVVAVVVGVLGLAGCGGTSVQPAVIEQPAAKPPDALTGHGRTLWNFEALLRDTFGDQEVCWSRDKPAVGLTVRGDCSTAAGGDYSFTFSDPRHSAFHLAKRQLPADASFGAHAARPVRVAGHVVACNSSEHELLLTSVEPLFCSSVP